MKQKQKRFAVDDGNSVTFKNGMVDRALYNISLALIFVGGYFWVRTSSLWLILPRKNKPLCELIVLFCSISAYDDIP